MIASPQPTPAGAEWLGRFRTKAARTRVPLRGMLELTSRCNLRCVHCYLGSQEEQHAHRDREMSTEQVFRLLDETAEAGCLYLTITGGDPMMRRDFAEIYTHARKLGMLVTVFCDAILVTDRILALFKDLPPRAVEVSLYGATAETYERVTRVPGSYPRAIAGIRSLLAHGVRVRLKTVLMTLNQHELKDMEAMAAAWGVKFRHDGAIFPCLPSGGETAGVSNDQAPVDLRVAPADIVAREMADPKVRSRWVEVHDKSQSLPATNKLYNCGAGVTSFYVDPEGTLSPCLLTAKYRYKLTDSSFRQRWETDLTEIRAVERKSGTACANETRGLCAGCPATNYLETGDEHTESEYMREITRLRYESVMAEKQKLALQRETDDA